MNFMVIGNERSGSPVSEVGEPHLKVSHSWLQGPGLCLVCVSQSEAGES